MAEAAFLDLPYPETAVVDEDSLTEQSLALAAALPDRPVVLGGCCCTHVGAVEGLATRYDRLAVVWFDAHGDLNTPESSPSGNQWGMPFRMLLDSGTVHPADAVLVGARNLDPPEVEFIAASGLRTGVDGLDGALDGADAVYVAFDADVLDPDDDVVCFMPEPGGFTVVEAASLLRRIAGRAPVAGVGVTGLGPVAGERRAGRPAGRRSRSLGSPEPRKMARMESRVDVTVENREAAPADDGKRHPNTCPRCHSHYRDDELEQTLRVCSQCGHHFPVRARERIAQLADRGTFAEEDKGLRSADPLDFFDLRAYTDRLAEAEVATGLGDALIAGAAAIERRPCELAVMDFAFMGGSMGSTVGEKFARACERAAGRQVPLVCVTASGGARMQEGILSLMQLPKTVCAVDELHEARCAFISVMTHPTTAGVLASFASLGDVIVSEPGALLAFTGPRVVQQTTREKLPDDFGLAESNARFGHVDAIVPRAELRPFVGRLLAMFVQAQ